MHGWNFLSPLNSRHYMHGDMQETARHGAELAQRCLSADQLGTPMVLAAAACRAGKGREGGLPGLGWLPPSRPRHYPWEGSWLGEKNDARPPHL
jgi:hypothetical protein